jgi:hypothetical protein
MKRRRTLADRYPPSEPCSCEICLAYCKRPGWWTVEEAARAIEAGYGHRMMLEMAPEMTFAVLSPAFRGCEGGFAENRHATRGCTFLRDDRCELHGTGFQPLECCFCHHSRTGLGPRCHAEIERGWQAPRARTLVREWGRLVGLWDRLRGMYGL